MPDIFKFFWFICAAFMAINLVIWRRRLATVVARGIATQAEVDTVLRGAAAWLVGGSLTLGLISLGAGWTSPLCAGILAFDSVPRSMTSVIAIAGWCTLLFWVWRGSGADFLARVGPALGQAGSYEKRYSPAMVRAFVTVAVIGAAVGSTMAWRSMPASPVSSCAAPPAAG
jgi:hypothetical protein